MMTEIWFVTKMYIEIIFGNYEVLSNSAYTVISKLLKSSITTQL